MEGSMTSIHKGEEVASGQRNAMAQPDTYRGVSWQDLPWGKVVAFLPGMDVARLQMTNKAFGFVDDKALEDDAKQSVSRSYVARKGVIWTMVNDVLRKRLVADKEVGRPLLRRHESDVSLAKLVHCMEFVPQIGDYISIIDYHVDPSLRDDPNHPANVFTRGDLHPAGRLQMGWVKILFVIDGVAVMEKVEARYDASRFEVVRLSLPLLLDISSTDEGKGYHNKPNGQHARQCCCDTAWAEGFYMYTQQM